MLASLRWLPTTARLGFLCTVVWLAALLWCTPPAVAQQSAPSPEDRFADAVALYNQHLYAAAQTAFSTFRTRHPSHASVAQALFLEASSALALNQRAHAVRLFQTLQHDHPNHPRARAAQLSLGQYFIDQGNVAEGRQQLQSVVNEAPTSEQAARALYLLGQAAQDQGDDETGLNYYQRVMDDHVQSDVAPAAYYAAASTLVRLDRYDAAATAFETLARRFPETPYAEKVGTGLAEVYYELERYDRVVEDLNGRLPTLDRPSRARAVFLLAESHHQRGRYGQAQEFYRQLLDAYGDNPYRPSAHYGLGWVAYRNQRYAAAASSFASAREAATDSLAAKATYYEAASRSLSNQADEALRLYRTFRSQWPRHPLADDALYEVALLHYAATRYGEAVRTLQALADRSPSFDRVGEAYYWMGNAYLAQEQLDQALSAYNEAASRNALPAEVLQEVRFQKAWALHEDDQHDEAARAFTALAESVPSARRGRDALFWAADSEYQTGDYDTARTLLLRYLNQFPDGRHAAAAQYALGWTHFEQQQYRPAARAFQRFLDSNAPADDAIPYRKDARLRLADSYFALKRYADAIQIYQSVGGTGADYALYQAAQALNRDDRPRQAIETYQELVNLYPDSRWRQEALYRVGYIYFQQQDYRQARQTYRSLLDRFPDSRAAADALYGIGDTHYNDGNLEQAAQTYQQVLSRYPDAPVANEAASSLFFALDAMGEGDRASAVVDSFAASNPRADIVEDLRFRRAETAYQSGDKDRAQRLFQQFLRTSTDESLLPEAYYYLGLIADDRDDPSQAATYLTPIVNDYPSSPRHAQAALRLGDIRFNQERYSDALDAYRTAAERASGDGVLAQARYGQSNALLELDRIDDAQELLQQLLDTSAGGPLERAAQLGLARIHEQEGRPEEALDLYQTVANRAESETGAEALFRLGRLHTRQGQHREAITTLERMASLFPGYPEWNAQALLTQADAHRALGQTDEAASLYDQVMQEHAGTRFAQTAQAEKDAL